MATEMEMKLGQLFSFHFVKSGYFLTTKRKISSPLSLVRITPGEDSGPKSVSGQRAVGSLTRVTLMKLLVAVSKLVPQRVRLNCR